MGLQGEYLIFLDPHVTKDRIGSDIKEIKRNHLQCHEETAKKLHFMKLEPTMTFCFYLRTHEDYRKFETFMEEGKLLYRDEWIFSSMDAKPAYMKQKSAPNFKTENFEELESIVPKTNWEQ